MEAKGPFEEGECLMIQRNFQWGASDSKSSNGIEVDVIQRVLGTST